MTMRVRVLSAVLVRAGLAAAVLAIMAGILGMHVMTADHSTHVAGHAPSGSPAGSTAAVTAGGHGDHSHNAGHAAVAHSAGGDSAGNSAGDHAERAIQAAEQPSVKAADACGHACPGIEEGGASCIPLATTGSLAVFPPKGVAGGPPDLAVHVRHVRAYSFIPSSPTPCELSISRT